MERWGEFEKFEWLFGELMKAYLIARKGKRTTNDEHQFEVNLFENIYSLTESIITGRYKPSRGIAFIVKKPVIREVFAAPFRDRVVHHFLYNMVYDWWDRRFIDSSYSCRLGKGTLYGIKDAGKKLRKVTKGHTKKAFVFKFDLEGYFMSLPRKGLYERVVWGLDRQFVDKGFKYQICKFLWREIIFDNPIEGVKIRGNKKDWEKLPKCKSLFYQPKGRGIVIGNLSSQLLSNIYLDLLDRFVVFCLGAKYYGRYVDDFFILVPEEEFEAWKKKVVLIENFLIGIGLKLHPRKRYIQPIDKGFEFLGAVIYPFRTVPGKRIKGNFWQAIEKYKKGEGDFQSIVSYIGHMKHIDSNRLIARFMDGV